MQITVTGSVDVSTYTTESGEKVYSIYLDVPGYFGEDIKEWAKPRYLAEEDFTMYEAGETPVTITIEHNPVWLAAVRDAQEKWKEYQDSFGALCDAKEQELGRDLNDAEFVEVCEQHKVDDPEEKLIALADDILDGQRDGLGRWQD